MGWGWTATTFARPPRATSSGRSSRSRDAAVDGTAFSGRPIDGQDDSQGGGGVVCCRGCERAGARCLDEMPYHLDVEVRPGGGQVQPLAGSIVLPRATQEYPHRDITPGARDVDAAVLAVDADGFLIQSARTMCGRGNAD